jgi:hypothetical protein
VELERGQQTLVGDEALGEAARERRVVVVGRPRHVRTDLGLERIVYEREQAQVVAQRVVGRDRGEDRDDMVGHAAFGVAGPGRAPVEPGAQPRLGQQRPLEVGLRGDRVQHEDSMGGGERRDHWDIPRR